MADWTYKIPRGEGKTLRVTTFYPEWHENAGEPYPLGGNTVWFTAKRSRSDPDDKAIFRKKNDGGGIGISGNVAVVELDAASTLGLTREVKLQCDVQVKEPGRDPWTISEGVLVVHPDVTRETA
jgi:hypothetical protein